MAESKRDDLLGSILRKLPGFRGYGQREDQKASEELTRQFVNQRLQQAKGVLDQIGSTFADQGNLDAVVPVEKLRDRLEQVRSLVDQPVLGSSGLIGKAVDDDQLDDLYDLEVSVMEHAETMAELSGNLNNADRVEQLLVELGQKVEQLSRLAEQRRTALKQLAE